MPTYREVKLEKVRLGVQQMVSEQLLMDADARIIDMIGDAALVQIRAFVWGESETQQEREIEYPADWWQAFKLRWFPGWLLKKHPAHMKRVTYSIRTLYPELRVAIPEHRASFMILENSEDWWSSDPQDTP